MDEHAVVPAKGVEHEHVVQHDYVFKDVRITWTCCGALTCCRTRCRARTFAEHEHVVQHVVEHEHFPNTNMLPDAEILPIRCTSIYVTY